MQNNEETIDSAFGKVFTHIMKTIVESVVEKEFEKLCDNLQLHSSLDSAGVSVITESNK